MLNNTPPMLLPPEHKLKL